MVDWLRVMLRRPCQSPLAGKALIGTQPNLAPSLPLLMQLIMSKMQALHQQQLASLRLPLPPIDWARV